MNNEPANLATIHDNNEKKLNKKMKSWFRITKKEIDVKNQIFKIVLTGILLSVAVGLSLIEFSVNIMGAKVPLRIFDITIMVFAIPIIGLGYTFLIGLVEPWLHLLFDSDHPPIQMLFDNLANVILVLSFYLIFYKILKINQIDNSKPKQKLMKQTIAATILIPLNALISSLCFALTLIILANTNFEKPDEYIKNIAAFYQQWAPIFFILFAIEIGRFILTYVLFSLIQRRLRSIGRY